MCMSCQRCTFSTKRLPFSGLVWVYGAGLLVAGFKAFKGQRGALLDELMTAVLPNLPGGKKTRRAFVIGEDRDTAIQMISALLLQLVQVMQLLCKSITLITKINRI